MIIDFNRLLSIDQLWLTFSGNTLKILNSQTDWGFLLPNHIYLMFIDWQINNVRIIAVSCGYDNFNRLLSIDQLWLSSLGNTLKILNSQTDWGFLLPNHIF